MQSCDPLPLCRQAKNQRKANDRWKRRTPQCQMSAHEVRTREVVGVDTVHTVQTGRRDRIAALFGWIFERAFEVLAIIPFSIPRAECDAIVK